MFGIFDMKLMLKEMTQLLQNIVYVMDTIVNIKQFLKIRNNRKSYLVSNFH